jgi:hypothetical protein
MYGENPFAKGSSLEEAVKKVMKKSCNEQDVDGTTDPSKDLKGKPISGKPNKNDFMVDLEPALGEADEVPSADYKIRLSGKKIRTHKVVIEAANTLKKGDYVKDHVGKVKRVVDNRNGLVSTWSPEETGTLGNEYHHRRLTKIDPDSDTKARFAKFDESVDLEEEFDFEKPDEKWHSKNNRMILKVKETGSSGNLTGVDDKHSRMLAAVHGSNTFHSSELSTAENSANRHGYTIHKV